MKVCLLTHTFPRFSGDTAAPFMHGVAQGLVESGNEVFVLTPYSPKFSKKWIQDQKYRIVTYKYIFPDFFHKLGYSETLTNDMGLPFIMWLLSPFMYFFGFLAILRLTKKEHIEIVNAHWILPNGFIACLASVFTGIPVVSTLPGSDVYMAQKNLFFNLLARFAALRSNWITSNSPQLIADLKDITKVYGAKFKEIIYGVDSNKFKPGRSLGLRERLGFGERDIVVLGVGRLVSKKGFKYLIKAAVEILRKNSAVKFALVGDGDEKAELVSLARKLNVDESFNFLGSIDYKNLPDYYRMADIFILPSVRDEKGNLDDQSVSVVEAMSSGLPVVTSDFSGYRLVITNAKSGYLVSEKDSWQIALVVSKLASSQNLRNELGRKARKAVEKNFSWQAVGKDYTKLFREATTPELYSKSVPKILNTNERKRIAKQIYNVLSHHLGSTTKLTCLDIGCSSGVITDYLAGHFSKVVGVDIDKEALGLAKKNYRGDNVDFEEMEAEKLAFKDKSFDVVIANQIYEFVSDDQKVFDEIYRVLKPGGVCFMGARNKYALIEAQYKLPFLSWFPREWSDTVIRLLGKGKRFIGKYRSYWQLLRLVKNFKLHDYTVKIICHPSLYGYSKLEKYSFLTNILPLEMLKPLFPNYIWIIEK